MSDQISLVEFRINELFGSLNHRIELKGGVTFIHGPNGCGKTTALLVVEGILKNRLFDLLKIKFSSAELDFSDGSTLVVQHVVQEKKLLQSDGKNSTSHENNVDQPQSGLSVILRRGRNIIRRKSNVISLDSLDEIRNRFVQRPSTIEKTFPFLMRTSIRTWRDRNTGEDYNLSEVLEEFGEKLVVDLPSWYTDITSRVPVGAIRTQRLFDFRASGGR